MPSCAVNTCTNTTKSQNKSDGITFHSFPSDLDTKSKWIDAIRNSRNDENWVPSKYSVVCSDHFDHDDFYTTEKGLRKIIQGRYPKRHLSDLPTVSDVLQPNPALPSEASKVDQLSDLPTASDVTQPEAALPDETSNFFHVSPVLYTLLKKHEEETKRRLMSKDNILKRYRKKIKHLQQTVRRLKARNKSIDKNLNNKISE